MTGIQILQQTIKFPGISRVESEAAAVQECSLIIGKNVTKAS